MVADKKNLTWKRLQYVLKKCFKTHTSTQNIYLKQLQKKTIQKYV